MACYIDADKSVGIGYLSDWYQNSIDDTKPPIWTDEHIEELTSDFIVIPKDAPTADVEEVVRCKDCKHMRKTMSGCYCLPVFGLKRITDSDAFCSYGERK